MKWHLFHRHVWIVVGYGGAGWHAIECTTCGAKDIA